MKEQLLVNVLHSTPLLILLGVGLILMLLDAFGVRKGMAGITALGLAGSALAALPTGNLIHPEIGELYYSDMIYFGGVHSLVHIFLCASALFSLFFIDDYLKKMGREDLQDVYALVLFSVIGMVMFATANDLIIVFIGLEMMSVCLYVLAGLFKSDIRSNEAGFKYFLLGAFASGFLLFGIALLYGLAGSTHLNEIVLKIYSDSPELSITGNPLFYPALGLILVGFLFKVAAFPFHSWTPDVYTGAPTPIVGFMATGSKLAAFVAFTFFALNAIPNPVYEGVEGANKGVIVLGIAAIASMLYGNLVALRQKNVKRILAYSSIAHTGYLLLGVAAGPEGYMNVIFYMVIYTIMTVGAFGVISMLELRGQAVDLDNIRGVGIKRPLIGVVMATFMFSLAGVPPLAGFMGKYLVFGSAVKAGLETGSSFLITLAILGVLTSVIGAYYYLRVIVVMYFKEPMEAMNFGLQKVDPEQQTTEDEASLPQGTTAPGITPLNVPISLVPVAGALILGVLLVVFGVYPSSIYDVLSTLYAGDGNLTMLLK